jgi:hypothetical protein
VSAVGCSRLPAASLQLQQCQRGAPRGAYGYMYSQFCTCTHCFMIFILSSYPTMCLCPSCVPLSLLCAPGLSPQLVRAPAPLVAQLAANTTQIAQRLLALKLLFPEVGEGSVCS